MAQETKQFLDEAGLARYNSHINDVTTGINLIRGSRDFTRDIDNEEDYILTSGLKGFHTVGDESAITYTTDDVGFTIATITRTSEMYDESTLTSSRFSLKGEKFITYSGEIRINSIGRLSKFAVVAEYMAFNIKDGNVGEFVRQKTISCNDLKINYQNVGEWQPFKFTIDLSDIEATWMYVRARIDVEASVSYRNLVVQYGEIQNPGWSQNPFDVGGSDELSQDLTIEEVEEAFDEMDESDPSYSAFYDVINQAKEASQSANTNAAAAEEATSKANTATANADAATGKANEAANKVNELVNSINDMTTGINLLCGTRDFHLGIKTVLNDKSIRSDGFANTGGFTITKDLEGYSVASLNASGLTSNKWAAIRGPLMPITIIEDEWFTISYEIMVDDIAALDEQSLCYFYMLKNDAVASMENSYIARTFQLSANENKVAIRSGIWIQVVHYLQIPKNANGLAYIYSGLQLPRNGSVHFKKLMVQRGKINHPVYAPNPNDIDYINDMTTGINLLHGTRDFRIGTKSFLYKESSSYLAGAGYSDGFFITSNVEITPSNDGFKVLRISQSGLSSSSTKYGLANILNIDKEIKELTISFDVMIEDASVWDDKNFAIIGTRYHSNKNDSNNKYLYEKDITTESVKNGKWYTVVYHYTLEESFDYDDCYIFLSLRLAKNGSINFKKPMVYAGHINNPIWSASPFDIDYINDETTGINLLRGTRDFRFGTQKWNVSASTNYFVDGFFFNQSNSGEIIKNSEGFSYVKTNKKTGEQITGISLMDFKTGDELTLGFEMMFDDISELNKSNVAVYIGISSPHTFDTYNTVRIVDCIPENIEQGIWYKAIVHYTVPKDKSEERCIRVSFPYDTVGASIIKPVLVKGRINNPIWSASPFDVPNGPVMKMDSYAPKGIQSLSDDTVENWISTDSGMYPIAPNVLNGIGTPSVFVQHIATPPSGSIVQIAFKREGGSNAMWMRSVKLPNSGAMPKFELVFQSS